jgi:putative endonuclease
MSFFVYILKSLGDNKLYIGQTSNIQDRINRHNTGQVAATRNRRPLKIIHIEIFKTRSEAMRREKYLKSLKSSKYIIENIVKT